MAVPPEEAERRCRRALMEAWGGPGDGRGSVCRPRAWRSIRQTRSGSRTDGRLVDLRLVSIADAEGRGIEAVRQDRATYDLPPGDPRAASLTRAVVFGAPDGGADGPCRRLDRRDHARASAAGCGAMPFPWPGEMAVFRSPSTDGFELLTTFGSRARTGGCWSRTSTRGRRRASILGNALVVDLLDRHVGERHRPDPVRWGETRSRSRARPASGRSCRRVRPSCSRPAGNRLTRLLRGQRGTEGAIGNPAPAGARVVVLDTALASLPIAEADLGIPWNWRIGPASRPVSDETYMAQAFAPAGVGLRPFSVADGPAEHVRGAVGRVCRKPFGRQAEAIPRARDPRARDHSSAWREPSPCGSTWWPLHRGSRRGPCR